MADNLLRNKWTWLIHVLFWLIQAIMIYFVLLGITKHHEVALAATVVNLVAYFFLAYGHILYLIPRFWDSKRYVAYGLGLLVLLILSSCFRFFIGWNLVVYMQWDLANEFTPQYFVTMLINGLFILMISLPLKLVNNWLEKSEIEEELKTHQLEAELRFLKAQVNPHFLFNALNNIYALSFTESKKAPEMILKLSDMMSYMLYDCNAEKVKLSAEVDYLRNYIDLQQLKKEGEYQIEFATQGNIHSIMIPPMLFIPFFENAFKHGNLDDIQTGWLKAYLEVDEEGLNFSIQNTFDPNFESKEQGGVGLSNIHERLQLLFPNRHSLRMEEEGKVFSVNLHIASP